MTNSTKNTTGNLTTELQTVVDRYLAVWSVGDPADRAKAVADLWSDRGIEYVEGQQYIGHAALVERVAEAYEAFVANAAYTAVGGEDAAVHGDVVTFTIRLDHAQGPDRGETAWSARVFLVLDEDGQIREDYQLTVQPLAA
ncbi:hypothetical protein ABH935_007228 [Catenulispora sp. GAS73]|uniref:nuclear transport factor 2 family protein n=1 Tax=Catenulispora sp. GAS73 TaxID=3156269 RepID=UPI00351250BF